MKMNLCKGFCFFAIALIPLMSCISVNPLKQPEVIAPWEEPSYGEIPWWNQGVFYEIYVRSFKDSDADRHGDFLGLIEKLDYLNDGDPRTTKDLGITAIWLMPIQENLPSNRHGYHTEDFYSVEQDYGSMEEFKLLIEEAHKRGIKVIIDLVINHVSNTHPWFQDALKGPESPYYDWFIWSDTVIHEEGPWGQPVWNTPDGGQSYYFAIFNFLIPDLNYRNPEVTKEILEVSRYWLEEVGGRWFPDRCQPSSFGRRKKSDGPAGNLPVVPGPLLSYVQGLGRGKIRDRRAVRSS
jgi:hypothetical protein